MQAPSGIEKRVFFSSVRESWCVCGSVSDSRFFFFSILIARNVISHFLHAVFPFSTPIFFFFSFNLTQLSPPKKRTHPKPTTEQKEENMGISKVHARQIFDSRGNPTVEVEVTTSKGKEESLAQRQHTSSCMNALLASPVANPFAHPTTPFFISVD